MSGILTTNYMVKASLEKYKYLLELTISKEFLKPVQFGKVNKPIKYQKPSKKRAMNIQPGDLLFFIEGVKEEEIKTYKKLFAKGEYYQINDLKLVQKGKGLFMRGIDIISDDVFFRQLVKSAGIGPEDPVAK
jgi:hypothetical protein